MNHVRPLSLAAACAAAALCTPAAHACSMVSFPSYRDGTQLIATATPDTVPAGAGPVAYKPAWGQADGPVYGQVVHVERAGGTDAAALPATVERAVLVPWEYDESCHPTRYTRSYRWVQPGERGLFWARLRPREQWVDGLPTFDVRDPFPLPYTPRRWAEGADSLLSIEQTFELIGLLPRSGDAQADPEAAYQPLLAWAAANPRLAGMRPASGVVDGARLHVRRGRLRRIDPPLAGTYRFSVTVDGEASRTFYARTRSAPMSEWDPDRSPAAGRARPALDDPFGGYRLLAAGSTSADSLPVTSGPGRDMGRESYFSVAAAPEPGPDGVQVWRGRIELGLAARALQGDSVLAGIARAEFDEMIGRVQDGEPGAEPVRTPARFLLRPDGSVTVEQSVVLHDGRTVVMRGERVSRVTIPDPDLRE